MKKQKEHKEIEEKEKRQKEKEEHHAKDVKTLITSLKENFGKEFVWKCNKAQSRGGIVLKLQKINARIKVL